MKKEENKKQNEFERQNAPKLESEEFLVEIEPISEPSKIDDRLRFSKFTWAVILVTGPGGESKCHAAILIEGLANKTFEEIACITDGEYFMLKTELDPPVKTSFYHQQFENDLEEMQRSEIWMKSSDKVIEMLKHIFNQDKVKFFFAGENSCFGGNCKGAHSCITWSREKLSMLDIHLGNDWFEKILTWPKNFTKPFGRYKHQSFSVQI